MAKRRKGGAFTVEELRAMGVDLEALERDEFPAQVRGRASRSRVHHPGVMNATEKRYAEHLGILRDAGRIADFAFESVKLRLGPDWKTSYTPDFLVVRVDGGIELHEVKGHWEDDARVKIKVAAALHPFVFVAVQLEKGAWKLERFPPHDKEE